MKNLLYFITIISLLFGCHTPPKRKFSEETSKGTFIEVAIKVAEIEIYNFLIEKGFDIDGKQMIFYSFGMKTHGRGMHNYKYKYEKEPCKLFYNQEGYGFINQNFGVLSSSTIAFILDKNGNYIASASYGLLNEHPEDLKSYSLELKMIELAQKNKYITFINLFEGCRENFIIGYKKGKIDVYQYTDDGEMIFKYTK